MMLLAAGSAAYDFLFWLFAATTCVFAAGVLFSNNIVRMAFYLVLSLGAASGLFFLAGAEFVGAMQLMIYVGGTLVLLIFGVMLTAKQRFIEMKTNSGEWIMALIVGSALFVLLVRAAFSVEDWRTPNPDFDTLSVHESKSATPIGAALAGVRVDKLDQDDEVTSNGMSGYLMPFVIVSVHLLVVLVGAAYMARAKRFDPSAGAAPRAPPTETVAKQRRILPTIFLALLLLGNIGLVVKSVLLGSFAFPSQMDTLREKLTGWEATGLAQTAQTQMTLVADQVAEFPQAAFIAFFLLGLIGTASCIGLLFFRSWGFVGLIAVGLGASLVLVAVDQWAFAAINLVHAAVVIGILFGLMRSGRAPNYWSQLD